AGARCGRRAGLAAATAAQYVGDLDGRRNDGSSSATVEIARDAHRLRTNDRWWHEPRLGRFRSHRLPFLSRWLAASLLDSGIRGHGPAPDAWPLHGRAHHA